MEMTSRINAFVQLGKMLQPLGKGAPWPGFESGLSASEYEAINELIERVHIFNGWFTAANVRRSFLALSEMLAPEKMEKWLAAYPALNTNKPPKRIAVIMAGNIPMVGFHDMLTVLISGNIFVGKLSKQDDKLLPKIAELLLKLAPDFANFIEFEAGRVEQMDAVIATGSNNSARYFEHYFGKYPNIIRKNRTSVAVLTGNETPEELEPIGEDIFSYYGLGCRNVTKVYLPEGFELDRLFKAIFPYSAVVDNKKYGNNYDYHRTLFMMNKESILENGFVVLKEDESLHAPTGTLFYSYYSDADKLNVALNEQAENIQCKVGQGYIPFGKAQQPELWDYADGVDTMRFLLELN